MTLIELIGFLIMMVAFTILSIKRSRALVQPEKSRMQREEELRELLESMGVEMEEEVSPPPPPPTKKKAVVRPAPKKLASHHLAPKVADRHLTSAVESRTIMGTLTPKERSVKEVGPSRGRALVASLKSPKEMVILHEILDLPKSSRPNGYRN